MGNPPYDPYGQQPQPGYGQQQPPAYGQQPAYSQQPPAYQQAPPPAYPAQPAYSSAPQAYGHAPQAGYGAPQHGGYGQGYGAYASWGSRVWGNILDGLLFAGPMIVVLILAAVLAGAGGDAGIGLAVILYIGLLIGMFVFGLMHLHKLGTTGQTFGKRHAGIKLVSAVTGQPIGFGGAFVRNLAHALEFGIGWLWPLWDEKRQTFADKICNTIVIRVQ